MWQVVGHDRAVDGLRRAIAANRLSHALLFTGPQGIGKTRLALELAKALNCVGAEPPCQRCIHCHQIEIGSHPDVSVVERPDGKDSIAIQQVRELRDEAALRPFQGRRKVYIISEAETLTPQAADALLKTLEEPQPELTLVLTATEDDAVPPTILSRCRVMALHPVDTPTVVARLIADGQERFAAERLARLARGSIGWALSAARSPKPATQQEEMIRRLSAVLDLDLEARLQLVESVTAEKKDRGAVRWALELLTLLARDVLLLSQGLAPRLVSGAERDVLERQAARLRVDDLHEYLQALRRTMDRIDRNVDPRLALEALMVSAP